MQPLAIAWVTPFVLMLLSIAVLPLAVPHWWEKNRNKFYLSLVLGAPVFNLFSLLLFTGDRPSGTYGA